MVVSRCSVVVVMVSRCSVVVVMGGKVSPISIKKKEKVLLNWMALFVVVLVS